MKKILLGAFVVLTSISTSYAQSLTDLFSKENIQNAVSTVTSSVEKVDLGGTWNYVGSAVELESENILKKAGGSVASSTIESKINKQLNKAGLKENAATFTFESDGTFIVATSQKSKEGKYTFDADTKTLNLEVVGGKSFAATVSNSGDNISLLFNADKLMDVISFVSEKVPNSTLKSVSTLVNAYDGMKVGLKLSKQ